MEQGCVYRFGPFCLDAPRRCVTREGVTLDLKSRAFDVLHLLVREHGRAVTKDEILAQVWRGVVVEENNLMVQISTLRRALGDYPDGSPVIVTVPNKGYALSGTVTLKAPQVAGPSSQADPAPAIVFTPRLARLGRARLAGIGAAILACAAIAGIWATQPSSHAAGPTALRLSLAILPFRNLSADPRDDSLADAVSDDLTTEMAHMPAATVTARASADSYKGKPARAEEIGAALHVRYVLEGSLRGAGDSLSVNAQLIRTDSGVHVWAKRFDVPRLKADEAQQAIVNRVAGALRRTLIQIEAERSLADRPAAPDALDLYLRATSVWDKENSREADREARHLLEASIRLAPDFVPALAELGWVIATRLYVFDADPDPGDLPEAAKAVAHALEVDRTNCEALSAQGAVLVAQRQQDEAQAAYQGAIEADPHCGRALNGLWRIAHNRAQWPLARDTLARLQVLDPENPDAVFWNVQQGTISVWLGRAAEAVTLIRRGMAGEPEPSPGGPIWDGFGYHRIYLAAASVLAGDVDAARRIMVNDDRVWPHRTVFRVAGLMTVPQLHDPMAVKILGALQQAGMPLFADEHRDDGITPQASPQAKGDFDPTPMSVPGMKTIDTAALAKLLQDRPAPLLIDVGHGVMWPAPIVKGARNLVTRPQIDAFVQGMIARYGALSARSVVVMGDGPYGWASYNAALRLQAAGVPNLFWYRGGEEAWTRAGLPGDTLWPAALR